MVAFSFKFLASVLLAIVDGSSALVPPSSIGSKHTTHRKREIAHGVQLETYHPTGNYETYAEGVVHPLRKRRGVSFKESSVAFLQSRLGIDADKVAFHSGYENDVVSHSYLKQVHDGIFFANAVANVAINKDDKVVALGHSFVTPSKQCSTFFVFVSVTNPTRSGNNAITFNGSTSGNVTSESGPGLVFDYPQDASTAPNTTANINAARVNNFYIVNSVHDISYRYGFTEAAFNFQQENFGKGGAEGDRITALIQAGSGIQVDDADFTTPPDGQGGIMRMYLWDFTSPHRDGAFENDIVVHENTHGISNRLTGGGTAVCFQTTEAGGMGEGWSDAMAEWTEQTDATIRDYVLGQYVSNNPAGVRTHPYSTNKTTNPLTYADVGNLSEVHNIGEVWANMLHNVYAALVGVYGFDATARTNPDSTGGNAVYLHLFIDALAIQPCSPTFVTARDAWIQADVNRYGGANKCLLWTQFASRGLGVSAQNHTNDATVPSDCSLFPSN
ncbi:Extracellular metalloproteinase [Mycena venus]|uniref:Extracellular metalloproteinase n=1 Tax=Mycena venus TaxID=2733690 RepID=A0A8H6XXJ5_9AGAR|nr:Extracellular metalloproteinase [Mycena venus]